MQPHSPLQSSRSNNVTRTRYGFYRRSSTRFSHVMMLLGILEGVSTSSDGTWVTLFCAGVTAERVDGFTGIDIPF